MNPLVVAIYPLRRLDYFLLLLVGVLVGIGLTTLASATDSLAIANRQQKYLIAGCILMAIAACLPWRVWKLFTVPLYLGTLVLLTAVEVIGIEVNNSRRWLDLGLITLQPSEIAKITVPLMIAWFYCLTKQRYFWQHLVAIVLLAIPAAIVFTQPDLGTAVMIAASGITVIFLAGLSWWIIGGGVIAASIAAPIVWAEVLKDYQRDRILSVIDPYQDPLGAGYHTIQSSIAVGSGGVWGKGLGQGTQSQLGFLPEKHTDFIFAVFAEELGFVGCVGLVALLVLIFFRMLVVAGTSKDEAGGLVVGAFAFAFVVQALINLGMVSGVLPVVGLPLPLISYGGTSLLTFLVIFGITMSVACHQDKITPTY